MTSRVLSEFKQKIDSFELVPSGGGCFEFSIDGELAYSKLKTGSFPDEREILREVGRRE